MIFFLFHIEIEGKGGWNIGGGGGGQRVCWPPSQIIGGGGGGAGPPGPPLPTPMDKISRECSACPVRVNCTKPKGKNNTGPSLLLNCTARQCSPLRRKFMECSQSSSIAFDETSISLSAPKSS